jgi:anion-transporting  ArsA/GET3 family ATPase
MLRVLSLPDSFRWLVRLLFGLDRGPGQSNASLNRALLPTSLLPAEWMGRLQDARMHLEHARDNAIAANHTTVRYVLRPDRAALHEARMAIPALYLHGLAVDAVIGGPLLPADATDTRLMPTVARQQAIIGEAERTWQPLPVLHLPLTQPENIDHFAALGQALYAGHRLEAPHPVSPPITHGDAKNPLLSIDLPGIQREALSLTISGDELIVQVGPYRRHVLLPDSLRGKNAIKASRDGNRLLVRLRQ